MAKTAHLSFVNVVAKNYEVCRRVLFFSSLLHHIQRGEHFKAMY